MLEQLLAKHPKSKLVPEAMLKLAGFNAARGQLVESDSILRLLRGNYPGSVEAVQALDMLGDNEQTRGNRSATLKLWKKVIDEARSLSKGKYVWYVNVQALLEKLGDRAREKITGKK